MKYLFGLFFLPVLLLGQPRSPIDLTKLEDSVWLFTSSKRIGAYDVPANGMIVQTSDGLVLVDTPWDDTLTAQLVEIARGKFHQEFALALITHAHDDRIGGIHALRQNNIRTYAILATCRIAKLKGYDIPDSIYTSDTTFIVGNERVEYFFPGPGHTDDNTVVWLPGRQILYGGCLVKSQSATDLGNIAEADVKEWPHSVRVLLEKFDAAQLVIPGHGDVGAKDLLQHTLDLLDAHHRRESK